MTNFEKLKSLALYPVKDTHINGALEDRKLVSGDVYSVDNHYNQMQLAKADIYVLLITAPNITESGFSLSMTEKAQLRQIASEIYDFYEVMNPLKEKDIIDSEVLW